MSLMISFSIMIFTNFILLLVFHTIEIIFKIKFVKYCFNFIYKMYMIYDDPARKRNKTKSNKPESKHQYVDGFP